MIEAGTVASTLLLGANHGAVAGDARGQGLGETLIKRTVRTYRHLGFQLICGQFSQVRRGAAGHRDRGGIWRPRAGLLRSSPSRVSAWTSRRPMTKWPMRWIREMGYPSHYPGRG